MNIKVVLPLLIAILCFEIGAQEFNNYAKQYTLISQTEAGFEAERMQRMRLADHQPSGLFVRKNERFLVTVSNLDPKYRLSTMIGFKPQWGNRNSTQENEVKNGETWLQATQDGILSFVFVKREGYDTQPSSVNVRINGGKAFPLYKLGRSNPANWANDLRTMTDAKFVQFVSDKALITLPYRDYMRQPMADIAASFDVIHKIIDLQDELAGFDDSSPENMRTRNRLHYLVDTYATEKEREDWYMYAMDHTIGMKSDNFTDLTDRPGTSWGVWHETGHTHQQYSWTWNSIGEISVNLFSLHVQEKFGQPSRLGTVEGDEELTSFEKARRYIANREKNYLVSNEEADYNELFSKLVMFHQLKSVYGWDAIKRVHQYFRKLPAADREDDSDEAMANRFIYAMCFVTKNNLVPFFKKWGLNADSATTQKVNNMRLPLPKTDPSSIFK